MTGLYTAKGESLSAVADAIREKTGKSAAISFPDGFVSEIEGIETGSGGVTVEEKDVCFFDYDGTLLHSYTVDEAAALTALPDGPTHDGLVFQGWNWDLEDIQALGRAVDVGAMYITDDGKTRLHIYFEDPLRTTATIRFTATVDGGVLIDWGDGTTADISSGTTTAEYTHTYADVGDHMITLDVTGGTLSFGSANITTQNAYGGGSDGFRNDLRAVEIGNGVTTISGYSFYCARMLKAVTIPNTVTTIGGYVFFYCCSLKFMVLPKGLTSLQNYLFGSCAQLAGVSLPSGLTTISNGTFYGCYSLHRCTMPDTVTSLQSKVLSDCWSLRQITLSNTLVTLGTSLCSACYTLRSITLPDGLTGIPTQLLSNCYGLTTITIPSQVTSISTSAFSNCKHMAEYHLSSETPPTLSATSAFTGIPDDCVIYVPQGCLEAYQEATNWATYADYMQEEPETA